MRDLCSLLRALTKGGNDLRRGAGSFVPDFDLIARPYQLLEYLALGPLLQQTRTYFLPELTGCRQALLLGDGDGRFLARLLARNRFLAVDAVDTSAEMLLLLRCRTAPMVSQATIGDGLLSSPAVGLRLRTHRQDALGYTPDCSPDLIATHFFFDCLTQNQLDHLVRRLVPTMAPKGLWLVSDFRIPTGRLRVLGALYVRALYLAFRLLTGLRVTSLPDHSSIFHEEGLERIGCHRSLFGLLTTELWQAGD